MNDISPFSAPPRSVQNEIMASRTDVVSKLDYLLRVSKRVNYALAAVAIATTAVSAYAISKERVQIVAFSRDEVGFEHHLFLDTMQVDGDSVMMALRHFVEDWRSVTTDNEHNKAIRWRAFSRVNVDPSDMTKIYDASVKMLPPQTEKETRVTYVANVSVSPKLLNGKEWRVDWDEYEQDISAGSPSKMSPKHTRYSSDVVITTVPPSPEFPDGVRFEPMMPIAIPGGEESDAPSK